MLPEERTSLRFFFKTLLEEKGGDSEFADDTSLFISGRLDSLAMTNLVMHLEKHFGIDFADVAFDVEMVDSINEIENFIAQARRT